VAKQTLEQPRQCQRQASDSGGEEQQKADHEQRPARDDGVTWIFTEQKVCSDDSDAYVDKGKQAVSNVHCSPPFVGTIIVGCPNCRNIAITLIDRFVKTLPNLEQLYEPHDGEEQKDSARKQ
jgi:hypothetical protein